MFWNAFAQNEIALCSNEVNNMSEFKNKTLKLQEFFNNYSYRQKKNGVSFHCHRKFKNQRKQTNK